MNNLFMAPIFKGANFLFSKVLVVTIAIFSSWLSQILQSEPQNFNLALKAFVVLRYGPVQPRMVKTFLAATLHYWGYRSVCQHPRL